MFKDRMNVLIDDDKKKFQLNYFKRKTIFFF